MAEDTTRSGVMDNVVIAGGSVVTEDIPSGVLAAGNPCKPVKELPKEDIPEIEKKELDDAEKKAKDIPEAISSQKPLKEQKPEDVKPKKKRRVIGIEEIKK